MRTTKLPPWRGLAAGSFLCLAAILSFSATTPAQAPFGVAAKDSPQFLDAFRAVSAQASRSTVRVRCDGHDVALGTIVSSDGWILTKASELKASPLVRLPDGRELKARLVGVHQAHDIALLKVEVTGLTPVQWRPSKEVPVGFWAVSAGPAGRPVAVGVVSVGTRDVPAKSWPRNHAGSGYLGVSLAPVEKEVKISQVIPGGGAAKAGLRVNDIIVAVSGKVVSDAEMLLDLLQSSKPGDEIEVRVKRGDKELRCKAKLGPRPLDRGEFQNHLGSLLSNRRTAFPTILQHDSIIRPSDCGGPLVDLSGRVIGINISRAGRTESYAVPTEVLRALLPDLQAGRLAPHARRQETASR
jgi:serine protease Do